MTSAKPSLELLRELSDGHVLGALLEAPRLTRAEVATRTGISKPTVAESVRRLVAAGVVVDTGERTTGPGRVGTYFAVSPDVGLALAVDIAPAGVTAELLDARGATAARVTVPLTRPVRPAAVAAALRSAVEDVRREVTAGVRLAVVSAADPVDRTTARLVHLPDAPFLVGALAPAEELAGLVDGPVVVDNDVNWAARAERAAAPAAALDDAVLLHLGEGLGCAVISDGEVRRGHRGLAGEVAHLVTTGPGGRACPLTEVFARLGLRHAGTTAVDVDAVLAVLVGRGARAARVRTDLVVAVAGLVAAAVALGDPAVVVLAGPWGAHPAFVAALQAVCADAPRPVTLRPAQVADAPLAGARADAVARLRAAVTGYRHAPGAGRPPVPPAATGGEPAVPRPPRRPAG